MMANEKIISISEPTPIDKTAFKKELEELINKRLLETGSDTPDFILAEYLVRCLENFEETIKCRDNWWDFDPWDRDK